MAIDTFTGATTGSPGLDWNTPTAWSTGALPGAGDTAVMAVPVGSSSAWGSLSSSDNETVTALELQSGFTLSLQANSNLDVQGATSVGSTGEILVNANAILTDQNAGNQDQVFVAGGTFNDANAASQDSIWFTSAGGAAVLDAAFGEFGGGAFAGTIHTLSQGGTLDVVGPAGNAASGASISGDTVSFGFGGGLESFAVNFDSTTNLSITISPTNPDEYVVTAGMATIAWAKAVSGDFSTATNWKGGVVPDASDEAFLAGDGGAAYTVTLDVGDSQTGGVTIGRIRSNANATLFLDNTGEGSTSDELFTSFNTSGAIDNVGYDIEAFGGTLKGALTNDADGVLDATGPEALRIDTQASVVNDGIFETQGAGALVIQATTVDNASGTIAGKVTLKGATIEGGAVSGQVVGAGTVLDGSTNTVSIGTLTVEAGASLTGEGLITNLGSFVVKGSATLEGALANDGESIETAGSGKLTVEGALSGDSDAIIDGGTMTFAASSGGTVIFEGSGELVLGQAENALVDLRNFATDGETSLDLEDVGFAGADEVTCEPGNGKSATLIVKGSNRTVQFDLTGDYLGVTFTAKSANGGAGSLITASQTTEAARFVQAAAAFTTTSAQTSDTHAITTSQSPSLLNLAAAHG